jgi:oligopeptidase B
MNKISNIVLITVIFIMFNSCAAKRSVESVNRRSASPVHTETAKPGPLVPPVAKIIPEKKNYNGQVYTDNYFWLRNRNNPDVLRYLEAENSYTDAVMKPNAGMQNDLYQEMLKRIPSSETSAPEKIDNYYYYTRREEGKQYPVYCRKKGSLEAREEILLDQNRFSSGKNVYALGTFMISPNHQYLAYSIDTTGSESYTVFVKNLNTGELLKGEIADTFGNIEWTNDNKSFYYTTMDKLSRPYRLYRHLLGAKPERDALIYQEKDEAYSLELSKTNSEAYILLKVYSNTATEYRYIGAKDNSSNFKVFQARRPGVEYYLEHHAGDFLVLTNENARNFKVVQVPVLEQYRNNKQELIPPDNDINLVSLQAFKDHLAVYYRENGLLKLRIYNFKTKKNQYITFDEPAYTISPEGTRNYNSDIIRYSYSSFVTPESVYEYNMDKMTRLLLKREEVPGGYNRFSYITERVFARSTDGTRVPISLVYKKGLARNGRNPLLLHAYGAYGDSKDPTFVPERISLLDRGFVFAIAHIRGGGEMGKQWYEQGKGLNKKNTFFDFISSAEYLVNTGYTSRDKLVIYGRSAGGLLMGAVTTMRPDLFKAVIAEVPFVDVINTMMDPTIPLTVIEYDEWGNPNYKNTYNYMMSYSPYDNIRAVNYPNMLITAGLNDPWVGYWEPAKFVAKMRALKTDKNMLLLRTDMEAGHAGASGVFDRLKNRAFQYAFIFSLLGIKE